MWPAYFSICILRGQTYLFMAMSVMSYNKNRQITNCHNHPISIICIKLEQKYSVNICTASFIMLTIREIFYISFLANVLRYVRYMLSAVRLSVVCLLSVTLVHPTQAVELFGNFFHHTIAQGLYFSGDKNHWWGTPLSPLNLRSK